LADQVPATPDGKLEGVTPVAFPVLYFISVMAEPASTVCAVLPEAKVMVGRAVTVTVAALALVAVQPAALTYKL
jgi:hypothetical protein